MMCVVLGQWLDLDWRAHWQRLPFSCPRVLVSSFVVDDDASMGGGSLCEFVMIGFALGVCN